MSVFNVPGVLLFLRYYKHAINPHFIVTYGKVKLINIRKGETTELVNKEVQQIIAVKTQRDNKLPWNTHEYFILLDSTGHSILVNSYTISLFDLWLDTLARRIPGGNVEFVVRTYPWFR